MKSEGMFARKMRLALPEEKKIWSLEENKHKLYNDVHRFVGGPLLYQVNRQRRDSKLESALFTMHPQDMVRMDTGQYIYSLHKMYMECSDPTEYAIATKIFGSFPLWKSFIANVMVAPFIEELREELQLKIKSEAIAAMRETMLTEGSKGTTAARFLSQVNKAADLRDEPGANSEKWKRGRAAAGLEETEQQFEDGFEEDIARLQLVKSS